MNPDLIATTKLIKKEFDPKINSHLYNRIYLFTNENLNEILNQVNLEHKKILTVCSSGDQYFNFLLSGATNIILYDINILSEYILYLKKACIETLTYEEFIDFFFPKKFNNKKLLSKHTFNKIKNNFSNLKTKKFWTYIFENFSAQKLYNSNLFIELPNNRNTIIKCNKYLSSKQNYNLLKQKLKYIKEIPFLNKNILQNNFLLEQKVDFIYLSNILDGVQADNYKEYLIKLKNIINNLKENLNSNGILGISYLYCYQDTYWHNFPCNIPSLITKFEYQDNFITKECQIIPFQSSLNITSNNPQDQDAIILYNKSK